MPQDSGRVGRAGRETNKAVTAMMTAVDVEENSITTLAECAVMDLRKAVGGLITADITFHASATLNSTIHIRTSYDGVNWDDVDLIEMVVPVTAGAAVQKSIRIGPEPKFVKVLVENDETEDYHLDATVVGTVTLTQAV